MGSSSFPSVTGRPRVEGTQAVNVKKYNPGFLSDDEVVESFCVRTDEFASIVESLSDLGERSSSHTLVIGPRGSGKTHLLLRVAVEVRRNTRLSGLFPIVFAEESYEVTTCGEFWLECLGHLAEQAPTDVRDNLRLTYEELRATPDDQVLAERCLGALLDFADRFGTRLLLVVENLNMLFSDMFDDEAGWRLRKTLQTEPRVTLLASATSRFEEIDRPDRALFELFRLITLRPLTTDECATLWQVVAGTPSSHRAVRPLEILTGGNARLVAIIARFGDGQSFRALMGNLLDLVDDHTEYFKSHLEALPPQERKVYLALARLWKPATAREVATAARLDANRCSALLSRLADRGTVIAESVTPRRKQYHLSERLYNIYYLLRLGGGSDRLVRALIDFMVCLYAPGDFKSLLGQVLDEGSTPEFLSSHMIDHMSDALLQEAEILYKSGKYDEALQAFDNALLALDRSRESDVRVAAALAAKCVVLGKAGEQREAIELSEEVLKRFGGSTNPGVSDQVSLALSAKVLAHFHLGEPRLARDSSEQTLALLSSSRSAFAESLIPAVLMCKGMALLLTDQPEDAIAPIDDVVARYLAGSPSELPPDFVVQTIALKALALRSFGSALEAEEVGALLRLMVAEDELTLGGVRALLDHAATRPARVVLQAIVDAGAQDILAPLVVALRQELGEEPDVGRELAEVAKDVRAALEKGRSTAEESGDRVEAPTADG